MLYVVIVQRTPMQREVHGPYRSFRRAEGDAKAWEANGVICTVEPLIRIS